ncbi:MAG TPA: response regulator [Candidatus Polarisedimenticolia bacterium]|jgi:CheY-like chemotaxis protein/signal transduction histidine kinase
MESDGLPRQETEKGAGHSTHREVRAEGFIILDYQGRVSHANAAASRILGIPELKLIGLDFIDHPWDLSTTSGGALAGGQASFLRWITDGESNRAQAFSIQRDDGSRQVISLRTVRATGGGGSPAVTAILLSEIAQSGRIDGGAIHDAEMEAFALAVGGIGNDFNNILTAIMGNTSLAKTDVDPVDEIYRTLDYIEKASTRAKNLARRLLDLSRDRTARGRPESLGALVKEALGGALSSTRVEAELRMPEEIPRVEIDYGQLRQALTLVLHRAAAAASRGSRVMTVSVEEATFPSGAAPPAGTGCLRIAIRAGANGEGPVTGDSRAAPPDVLGPALEAARAILKARDVRLESEANLEGDFVVSLYIPLVTLPVASEAMVSPEIIRGTGRVLVMDDEEMVRDVLGKMLGRLGYTASFAADGMEALALYAQALDSGSRFHAVLMDLTVPGRMGGREAMTELLKVDPSARVIVSTGFSTDPILTDFRLLGFLGAICKPYEITELSHTIHLALDPAGL